MLPHSLCPLSTVLFTSPVPLPYSSLLFLSPPTPTLPPLLSPHPLTLYFAFCIHSNPPLVHPCSSHPMILFLLQCPSILLALILLLCISLFSSSSTSFCGLIFNMHFICSYPSFLPLLPPLRGLRTQEALKKGYTLAIPGSWQGRYDTSTGISVIGDKSGGMTAQVFRKNRKHFISLYQDLQNTVATFM